MGHLRLKDGTAFPINLSVGDIRDISKRTGVFSKTVTLVGDDDNNNLLNHYYDVNVQAGTFDVNKLQECQIFQNGLPILENAYMQLVEVVKVQEDDSHNQSIEYKVLVKDSVSDFFTKIGNATLAEIDMNTIVKGTGTVELTSTNVTASFSNDISDGYKFLMPFDDDNEFNVKAFHPAMYAKTYFDSIFNSVGFTYEWGNLTPTSGTTSDGNFFEKLLIPYNGGQPQLDRRDYLVEATYATGTGTPFGTGLTWKEQVTGFTEVTDGENLFDPALGDYSVPFWAQGNESYQVQVTLDIDVDIVNNSGSLATKSGTGNISLRLDPDAQAGGGWTPTGLVGSWAPAAATIANGASENLATNFTATVNINCSSLSNTDVLEFYLESYLGSLSTISYDQVVDVEVTVNSSDWSILPSANTVGYQTDLNLNNYIPKQIKQADFVKSIFQMYNLFAERDKTQPNKLILQHRDDYYDSGTEVDWTEKLAKDSEQTIQFLPELGAKKTVLTYKDDDDDPNKTYKEATNETYGQLEFTFENEYIKGVDRKELVFSPTPIKMNSFNAVVPLIGWLPETNIRILIDGGTQTCDPFAIYDYYQGSNGFGATNQTTAPLITHFDDPITPTFDLNYAVCDYYFYNELSTKTNNNLYNLYWRRTLGQIDKGKLLTAWFNLDEADIQSIKLNDKIRIDNSWWNINKIIDYDANDRKLTKVELMTIDDELEFTPFAETPSVPPIKPNDPTSPIRPVRPVRPVRPEIVRPVKEILAKNQTQKNLWSSDSSVWVAGINNKISNDVKRAIILGDSQEVTEDKILAPTIEATDKFILPNGDEITSIDNFATADLTFTGDRLHELDSNKMEIDYNGAQVLKLDSKGVTINEDGDSLLDFRVEGDTDIALIFADASLDKVGIGSAVPSYKLDVNGDGRFDSGLIINDGANNSDTRIEGQTDNNLFFVDASTDRVGIGTNTPSRKLHVYKSSGGTWTLNESGASSDSGYRMKNTINEWSVYSAGSSGNLFFRDITGGNTRMRIDTSGNIVLGSTAALATTATDGFTYIPKGSGAPTGTPTSYTGKVPMYYDDTNQVLYIYSGGAWNAH